MFHKDNLTTPQRVITQTLSVAHPEKNQLAIKILSDRKQIWEPGNAVFLTMLF